MREVPALISVFLYLSLLTIGGGMAAFPELKTLTVDVHHWLTVDQLVHLYSLGQLSPGPNMMVVVSIGEKAGGGWGAFFVILAFFGPPALLAFVVGRLWRRLERWPWRSSIQRGLAPVSIGLLLSGWISLSSHVLTSGTTAGISLTVFVILLKSRVNPAFLILGSGLLGGLLHLV